MFGNKVFEKFVHYFKANGIRDPNPKLGFYKTCIEDWNDKLWLQYGIEKNAYVIYILFFCTISCSINMIFVLDIKWLEMNN